MHNLTNRNVIQKDSEHSSYLQFRRLLEYPGLFHMITLKPWDVGTLSTWEKKEETARNTIKEIAEELRIDEQAFVRPCQTHSDHIRRIGEEERGIYPDFLADTDGLVTDVPGTALLLGFGDCTPLLFYDPVQKAIANIHSGWRGTLARIGSKAVTRMQEEFGSRPEDLICCIGPHIRSCHFEVDEDVYRMFAEGFSDFADFETFVRRDAARNKYFIDTTAINRKILRLAGLKEENIIDSEICTVCESSLCHSYRAEKAASGRMAAVIGIRKPE